VLASRLHSEAPGLSEPISRFLRAMPSAIGAQFLGALLERADDDPPTFDLLLELLNVISLNTLRDNLDPVLLTESAAATLVFLVREKNGDPAHLSTLLLATSTPAAVAMLEKMPPASLLKLRVQLRDLLARASGVSLEKLVRLLLGFPNKEMLKPLAEAFVKSEGSGYKRNLIVAICNALVDVGLGEEFLLPLFKTRKTETSLRLTLLECFQRDSKLLEEASKWRPGEMLESPEVRKRLKALRKTGETAAQ